MLKLGRPKAGFRLSPGLINYAILILAVLIFMIWRLGDLAPASGAENHSRMVSANLNNLTTDAVNAPYRLVQHALGNLHPSLSSSRLASVLFAVVFIAGFYLYVRGLFGRIIGLLGSLLLISLPFFTISSRTATPQIMLFFPALLVYLHFLVYKTHRAPGWWLLTVAVGLSLYTPGLLWWVIGATALSYRKLRDSLANLSKTTLGIGVGLLVITITPLIVVTTLHFSSWRDLAAVPPSLPSPRHFGAELLRMAAVLFIRSPGHSNLLLETLPILSLSLTALVLFGGYALYSAAKDKAVVLGSGLGLAIILAALNSSVSYLALSVPALLIFATAGLRYLYVEWRSIFPRNPVPKTFALILIALVGLSQLYYAANYSLHAWPHSPAIRKHNVIK